MNGSTYRRADVPAHGALASFPEGKATDAHAERERLYGLCVECAHMLNECDWRGAARAAYTAAWSFARLPTHMQVEFVVSDLHDDDGPMPVEDDWSASAFVTWFLYRINRSAEDVGRRTPKPRYDANGRKLKAGEESIAANESIIAEHATDSLATLDVSQASLFDAPTSSTAITGKL